MSAPDIRKIQQGQSDQDAVVNGDVVSCKSRDNQMRIWHQLLQCEQPSKLGQISSAPLSLSPRNRFEFVQDREQNPQMFRFAKRSFVVPAMIASASKGIGWFGSPDMRTIGPRKLQHLAAVEEFHLTRLLNEMRAQLLEECKTEADVKALKLHPACRMPNLHLRTNRTRWSQKNIAAYAVSEYVAVAVAEPKRSYRGHYSIDRVYNANNHKCGGRNKQTVAVDQLTEIKLDSFAIAVNAPGFEEGESLVQKPGWMSKLKGGARTSGTIPDNGSFLWSAQMMYFMNTGAPVPWITMDRSRYMELWDEVKFAQESRKPTLFIVEGSPHTE